MNRIADMDRCALIHDLISECKNSYAGSNFTPHLRDRIEMYVPAIRKQIAEGYPWLDRPLFIASIRGQAGMVTYLVKVCHANVDQGCTYFLRDGSEHVSNPLWCAAILGKLFAVRSLLGCGADVNATNDVGSTAVHSVCTTMNLPMVKFLIENGADINKRNYNEVTCLSNAVRNPALCEYLLDRGTDINAQDLQGKTALHTAILVDSLETTELLFNRGADCHIRNAFGDDALQTACVTGSKQIFQFLTSNIDFSQEQLANGHELMGAAMVHLENEVQVALYHWQIAIGIREELGLLPKTPITPAREYFRYQKEFENLQSLNEIAVDRDGVIIQSLLVTERILGPNHPTTISRVKHRAVFYLTRRDYQRSIDLWRRVLEFNVKLHRLSRDTTTTALTLLTTMMKLHVEVPVQSSSDTSQRFHDIVQTFQLLTDGIMETRQQLLANKPIWPIQKSLFDTIACSLASYIFLLVKTADTKQQKETVLQLVKEVVRIDVRAVKLNHSLLHMAVSDKNFIRISDVVNRTFAAYEVCKVLLEAGAPVNAVNWVGDTPLHVATSPDNYRPRIVELLLEHGAHIDQPRVTNITAATSLARISKVTPVNINLWNHVNLQCLCATVIAQSKISYRGKLPESLKRFVQLHEPGEVQFTNIWHN